MAHDNLAKRIAKASARAVKAQKDLCDLLKEAADLACQGGHISQTTREEVIAPKES